MVTSHRMDYNLRYNLSHKLVLENTLRSAPEMLVYKALYGIKEDSGLHLMMAAL